MKFTTILCGAIALTAVNAQSDLSNGVCSAEDAVCTEEDSQCLNRYIKNVADTRSDEYQDALDEDELLENGSTYIACYPDADAQTLLASSGVRDDIGVIAIYEVQGMDQPTSENSMDGAYLMKTGIAMGAGLAAIAFM